jgi:hypothetical protein
MSNLLYSYSLILVKTETELSGILLGADPFVVGFVLPVLCEEDSDDQK